MDRRSYIGRLVLQLRTAGLERRLAEGSIALRRNFFVTVSEIAGFLHPPAVDCRSASIARSDRGTAAVDALPPYGSNGSVLPLGQARGSAGEADIGFRTADLLGPVYLCGKARAGKTWLLESMAIHLAKTGAGLCFVDPHRDAVMELADVLGNERDLLVVDLMRKDGQLGLNPLEIGDKLDVPDVVARTVGAFQAAYGWSDRSHPRTLVLARMATQALVEANLALPNQMANTLFQLRPLLVEEDFRDAILKMSSRPVERYFRTEFPTYEPGARAPILDKLSALRADTRTMLLFGQSVSAVDPRLAMDEGGCLLVSLAGLGDKSQLVGSLVVYEFFRAAKARAEVLASDRRPFFLICDEVQLYQGDILAAACGETPKYGLKLILANQFLSHLDRDVRNAILANQSQLISFTTDHADAAALAEEMSEEVTADDLVSLSRFECMARVTLGRDRLSAFRARTFNPADVHRATTTDPSVRRQGTVDLNGGPTREEVEKHQDELEDRIKDFISTLKGSRHAPTATDKH